MNLDYWFMFPVSILIATIAMAAGVGGATFFSPMFILALGLPPDVAIGTGLITQVFGFASGVFAYGHKRLIDYHLGRSLLVTAVPMALLGTLAANWIASDVLKILLGTGLFALAISFLRPDRRAALQQSTQVKQNPGNNQGGTSMTTREGEEIRYTVRNPAEGRLAAGVGGLFLGLISTGLGELNGYYLLKRSRVPVKVSIATNIFVVSIAALAASAGHFIRFINTGGEVLNTVLNVVIFTVPGVIIGAQLGSKVGSRIPQKAMERGLSVLFTIIAALTLGEVIL